MNFLKCPYIHIPKHGFAGYMASPYSHPEIEVRNKRTIEAASATYWFMQRGVYLYSPIVYTDLLCVQCSPDNFTVDAWLDFDKSIISSMPSFFVLMLQNWKQSRGMSLELRHANANHKNIYYILPTTTDDLQTYAIHNEETLYESLNPGN